MKLADFQNMQPITNPFNIKKNIMEIPLRNRYLKENDSDILKDET